MPDAPPPAAPGALEIRRRAAALGLGPASADPDTRTVEAVLSAGAKVRRFDWIQGRYYDEALVIAPDAVRLDRLNAGASVLDTHDCWSIGGVLGAVVPGSARIEAGGLVARLLISDRPEIEPVWADIRSGVLRHLSVGYVGLKTEIDETVDPPLYRVTEWEPMEVSIVPVPADPAAQFRSAPGRPPANRRIAMATEAAPDPAGTPPAAGPAPTPPLPPADLRAAPAATPAASPAPMDNGNPAAPDAAVRAERSRIAELHRIAAVPSFREAAAPLLGQAIESGMTVDAFRAAVIDAEAARAAALPATRSHITAEHDAPEAVRAAMADYIVARTGHKPIEGRAASYRGWGLIDMGAELMRLRGTRIDPRNRGAVADLILSRSAGMTSSDFPLLLADAANKILLPQYQAAAPTYRMWAARRNFADFRSHKFLRLGDFPGLQVIGESGEMTYGSISENREPIIAKEYGRGIRLTRQMLINDELGAFQDFVGMAGLRAAYDENVLVYAVIAANGPTLSDGYALFEAAHHANKASAASTVDETNYGIAVAAMREQTSLDGLKLNIQPAYLVVGTAKEAAAKRLVTSITPATSATVNPWAGSADVVVDPQVGGNRWHLFGNPLLFPTVVYGYVDGADGPVIRSEIDFDTRALKVVMSLDFAAGAIDYRGAYLNAGA